MNESENRQQNRVNVELPLQFYSLDAGEERETRDSEKKTRQGELGDILSSLNSMVNEINRIKKSLQDVIAASENNSSGHVSDLSAKGLRFFSDKVLIEGEIIKLKLALPFSEETHIDIEAKVIWVRQSENDKWQNETAVEFVGLNEKDESHIVKYTFMREREEALNK